MEHALDLHRLHFAFTATFHYIFPQLDDGTRAAAGVPENESPADRRRALQRIRTILGAHFRY